MKDPLNAKLNQLAKKFAVMQYYRSGAYVFVPTVFVSTDEIKEYCFQPLKKIIDNNSHVASPFSTSNYAIVTRMFIHCPMAPVQLLPIYRRPGQTNPISKAHYQSAYSSLLKMPKPSTRPNLHGVISIK